MRSRSWRAMAVVGPVLLLAASSGSVAHASSNVLLVCPTGPADHPGTTGPSLTCPAGSYSSIQTAVTAASAGDWVLVAPGDYHETGTVAHPEAGVYITTPNIHLRGMDRNGVVVDGTNASASGQCSSATDGQNTNGGAGRNGVEVFKADGTYIENFTACNYLAGSSGRGNEIWWNGGDGTGTINLNSYWGNYITGTTTFTSPTNPGQYGIFVSNSRGPGVITYGYASNMADSGFYVGACPDCNATLDHVHSENNALGYSGTNAGGHLTIKNSEWDNNKAGIVPNSLNNDDAPPPQSGLCPASTTVSCTFITGNHVHDNNNPNVPGAGVASAAPIGSGIELSGASFNTVDGNTVDHQNGWGIVIHDYPDTETPPASGVSNCQGGINGSTPGSPLCTFLSQGNVVTNNVLSNNGGFGNPTNGDLALESSASNPRNCFSGNTDVGGLTSDPAQIETVDGPPCNTPGTGDSGLLLAELVCASGAYVPCPNTGTPPSSYPQSTGVKLMNMVPQQTMANPCAGVPNNAWCAAGQLVGPGTNVPEAPLLLLLPLTAVGAYAIWRRRLFGRRADGPRTA